MDFEDTKEEAAFRAEARAWLAANAPKKEELAGMDEIDVQLGQFVLAGEPVATMASPKLASADPADIVSTQPVLYIEFRKDGSSIDPAPWWAASSDEKVGG